MRPSLAATVWLAAVAQGLAATQEQTDQGSSKIIRNSQTKSLTDLLASWAINDDYAADSSMAFKIVGGTKQTKNLPWFTNIMVVQEVDDEGAQVGQCAGTLIAPNYVLTAAHCFYDTDKGEFYKPRNFTFDGNKVPNMILQIGGLEDQLFQTSRGMEGGSQDFVKRFAKKVICHPKFDASKFANDICILRLNAPLFAPPVRLNFVTRSRTAQQAERNTRPGTTVTALGYGHTRSEGKSSPHLRKAKLRVLPPGTCQKAWGDLGLDYRKLADNTICVTSKKPGAFLYILRHFSISTNPLTEDTCQGDSGGPIMNEPAKVQVGITSFGIDCASGVPSVYTQVVAYQSWIEGVVGPLL